MRKRRDRPGGLKRAPRHGKRWDSFRLWCRIADSPDRFGVSLAARPLPDVFPVLDILSKLWVKGRAVFR